jgi:Ni/Co efflux regulator RcnB
MNRRSVLCAALALTFATTGSSFAQGNGHQNQPNRGDQQDPRGNNDCPQGPGRCGNADNRPGNQARRPMPQQSQRYQQPNQPRSYNNARPDERGAGPDQAFHRGSRLPAQYRTRQYVVEDWRGHRLSAPPRGYHWVQSGGDYLLVAIATGVIMQLILSN